MKTSSFADSKKRSPLSDLQNLKPGMKKKKSAGHNLALALPLTSLIDAFSIIVIYLLIGTQNSGMESPVPTKMNLPIAEHSVGVEKETPILTIQKGVYRLNDVIVPVRALGEKLAELKAKSQEKSLELLVQADQEMKYEDLDPLLKASSLSGFEKMKFAVVPAR
ncbi:biopolymer transporter ExbD [Bdellovibrio sp. 22V]|uniref:ExbD/TolR family protein n=1 Tax=Bdellovibrio TaxID=958 RepID=UPI0025437AE7|nr:biopolymer transporter ExbD [Bdellovibrio sp. 22V]WII71900.1 biopolymer transporter ExbD [Bdellovibrio sp. 22V]